MTVLLLYASIEGHTAKIAHFVEQAIQPRPFVGQKSREVVLVVERAGIGHMMGSLKVGTEDKLPALAQSLLHMQAKALHELILVIQHRKVVFAQKLVLTPQSTRGEHRGYRHLVEICLDETALAVCLFIGEAVHNGFREMTGVDPYATIFACLFVCGLGVPLPEEFFLIMAGYVCFKTDRHWVPMAMVTMPSSGFMRAKG